MSCSVPVRASCPQPQNSATPKKQSPVATREAKGAPMRQRAQHSNRPAGGWGVGGRGDFRAIKGKMLKQFVVVLKDQRRGVVGSWQPSETEMRGDAA